MGIVIQIWTSVYTKKQLTTIFYVVRNFRNVILFLKINDNETPRSYHDPKVPAHDVWRFFQVLLLMLMCWSHLKSRIPFSLIFTTYKAYILIYIMPYTKTKCVIQYIYVLFSQMFTVNNKVVYPGASLCAQ